jgi:hypothetical protein
MRAKQKIASNQDSLLIKMRSIQANLPLGQRV